MEAQNANKVQQTFASGVLNNFRAPVFLGNFKVQDNMMYINANITF